VRVRVGLGPELGFKLCFRVQDTMQSTLHALKYLRTPCPQLGWLRVLQYLADDVHNMVSDIPTPTTVSSLALCHVRLQVGALTTGSSTPAARRTTAATTTSLATAGRQMRSAARPARRAAPAPFRAPARAARPRRRASSCKTRTPTAVRRRAGSAGVRDHARCIYLRRKGAIYLFCMQPLS